MKRQINTGENGKCYEAFSPQHHPAVHTIQTAGAGRAGVNLFNKFIKNQRQEISGIL